MMALVKLAAGQPAEALRLVSAAMGARKPSPQILLNHGLILEALKRYQEAVESFDQAIKLKSRYAEAHNNRGAALTSLGRDEEALESCRKAIAIKPDYVEAHYNAGTALRALGRYDEALKSFDRALALQSEIFQGAQQSRRGAGGAQPHRRGARLLRPRAGARAGLHRGAQQSRPRADAASTAPTTRSRISRSRCGSIRAMPRHGISAADIYWISAATTRPPPISRRRWRCGRVMPKRALPPVSPNCRSSTPTKARFRAGARPMSRSCAR